MAGARAQQFNTLAVWLEEIEGERPAPGKKSKSLKALRVRNHKSRT
jgi:hypothetical protein